MNTIYLISKNFINSNEILKEAELIAKELKVDFSNKNNLNYIELQFFLPEERPYFEFMMDGEKRFNQTKMEKNFIENYGIIGYFYYDYDSPYFIPFLKLLLNKYSELLIFNDEGPALNHPFVYTKAHLEAYTGKFADIFTKAPKL